MKRGRVNPDLLPPVLVPSVQWWQYFRIRHLPTMAAGVTVVAAVWLWAVNLPEPTGSGGSLHTSHPVAGSVSPKETSIELINRNAAVANVRIIQPDEHHAASKTLADND